MKNNYIFTKQTAIALFLLFFCKVNGSLAQPNTKISVNVIPRSIENKAEEESLQLKMKYNLPEKLDNNLSENLVNKKINEFTFTTQSEKKYWRQLKPQT